MADTRPVVCPSCGDLVPAQPRTTADGPAHWCPPKAPRKDSAPDKAQPRKDRFG